MKTETKMIKTKATKTELETSTAIAKVVDAAIDTVKVLPAKVKTADKALAKVMSEVEIFGTETDNGKRLRVSNVTKALKKSAETRDAAECWATTPTRRTLMDLAYDTIGYNRFDAKRTKKQKDTLEKITMRAAQRVIEHRSNRTPATINKKGELVAKDCEIVPKRKNPDTGEMDKNHSQTVRQLSQIEQDNLYKDLHPGAKRKTKLNSAKDDMGDAAEYKLDKSLEYLLMIFRSVNANQKGFRFDDLFDKENSKKAMALLDAMNTSQIGTMLRENVAEKLKSRKADNDKTAENLAILDAAKSKDEQPAAN